MSEGCRAIEILERIARDEQTKGPPAAARDPGAADGRADNESDELVPRNSTA